MDRNKMISLYQHVQVFLILVIVAFGAMLVMGVKIPEDSEPWVDKVWQVILLLISPGTVAEFLRKTTVGDKEAKDETPAVDTRDLSSK